MSELTAVSLFAGIGGFDLALERAGVTVAAGVEINEACRSVLARHFPRTALFNDVTEVTGDQLRAAGFVPERGILTGGFPCQDLSIAGRRAGLAGSRSGLFWHVMRLADELRPRWLLLENVPGLLSAVCSCPGDDTCTANARAVRCGRWDKRDGKRIWLANVAHVPVGGACAGGCMAVHGGAMGTVLGALGQRGYGFAYRVLDAQFFGVPQRRPRVIIAGCLGDWAAPVQVLLDPESGTGDPAARSAARAGTAGCPGGRTEGGRATVGTVGGNGPGGGWRVGADEAAAGQLVVAAPLTTRPHADEVAAESRLVTSTLQGGGRRGHRIDAEGAAGGQLIPVDLAQITHAENRSNPQPGDPAPVLSATGRAAVAYALTARADRADREQTWVTHTLTSEGADASEDGTGRGVPLVPASAGVRRLTPLEEERLQGFPDEWTRWRADGTEQSDSARYRQCGNAVAVPVIEWGARRIVAIDAALSESGAAA